MGLFSRKNNLDIELAKMRLVNEMRENDKRMNEINSIRTCNKCNKVLTDRIEYFVDYGDMQATDVCSTMSFNPIQRFICKECKQKDDN